MTTAAERLNLRKITPRSAKMLITKGTDLVIYLPLFADTHSGDGTSARLTPTEPPAEQKVSISTPASPRDTAGGVSQVHSFLGNLSAPKTRKLSGKMSARTLM